MKTSAIHLIANERERQVKEEGYSSEHDMEHGRQELVWAAVCYLTPQCRRSPATRFKNVYDEEVLPYPEDWPWDAESWKPIPDNRIRELVKAGALIVAEIERLQKLEE